MCELKITVSLAVFLLAVSPVTSFGQSRAADECARTSQMEIYSDAQISPETGDLSGFELAVAKSTAAQRSALLYVYEGGRSEGIPLTATTNGDNLTVEGTWVEHLTQYPSKKEILQTRKVKISGKITPKAFRGAISIEDFQIIRPDKMRLKRVRQIWFCNARSSQ